MVVKDGMDVAVVAT